MWWTWLVWWIPTIFWFCSVRSWWTRTLPEFLELMLRRSRWCTCFRMQTVYRAWRRFWGIFRSFFDVNKFIIYIYAVLGVSFMSGNRRQLCVWNIRMWPCCPGCWRDTLVINGLFGCWRCCVFWICWYWRISRSCLIWMFVVSQTGFFVSHLKTVRSDVTLASFNTRFTLYDSVLCECPVVKWSSCVRRRLASARGCRGSTRLRRLVLAAAFALAGSAIDEAFQTPPLTSDTHSLLIQRALFLLCLWTEIH